MISHESYEGDFEDNEGAVDILEGDFYSCKSRCSTTCVGAVSIDSDKVSL